MAALGNDSARKVTSRRKLRFGMIGGGQGAFIGGVHRIAAIMDGQAELVAGAFSSTPAKSKASGRELFVPADRTYGSYVEMAEAEARRPKNERLDFIAIVTPNYFWRQASTWCATNPSPSM